MSVDRCIERVDLFLRGFNLPKVHSFDVADPFAAIFLVDKAKNTTTRIGTSEIIRDNANPQWTTVVTVDYLFETRQELMVKIFNAEASFPVMDETKHKLIGETRFLLTDLMCAMGQKVTKDLEQGGKTGGHGSLEVRGEVQTNTRDLFLVTFSGNKLANKDGFFGTSDPFLVISRLCEDGSYTVVWKSVRIDNSLSPRWAQAKLLMTTLCNGDIDRPLRIEIFDWDSNGKHESMGVAETSVRGMLGSNGAGINVVEADKKKKNPKYVNSGTLHASNCSIEHHPTFADYITGGCEISLVVGIDFTGSNGDPSMPNSLHFIDGSGVRLNQYEQAITAVGGVLEPYDSDNMYPVYGFGARCRQGDGTFSPVQHCFPVYGGGVEVKGVSGILQAYKDAITHVQLSGPTLFTPLISTAAGIAAASPCTADKQKYTILLILTDGVINDMEATKAALVAASRQAMSVIIIGVGSADFSDMSNLDCDGKMLQAGNDKADRDIVQFVSFKDNGSAGASVLAQQVLAEVPGQFLQFMNRNNIMPGRKK